MPGSTDSVTPKGNLGSPSTTDNENRLRGTIADVQAGSAVPNQSISQGPGSEARPSNAIAWLRSPLRNDHVADNSTHHLLGADQALSAEPKIGHRISDVRRRSDHLDRIYKTLLVLAIAVALVSLVPRPGNSDEPPVLGSRQGTADVIDAGSPDAPPPDVLIQSD